ncbi:MAG: hypothetical protein QXO74_05690 [Candidatus Methanomethylicia archaeon]
MDVSVEEYLGMIENFISYLEAVRKELPEDAQIWVEEYYKKLSESYGKAKETGDPRIIAMCMSMIREIIGKLVYETITETSPPKRFAANIMRNLGYDVKWVNEEDMDLPFDLIAFKDGGLYLISVKYSEDGESKGFSNTWTGEMKYFCNRLNAQPLVLLICRDSEGFGAVFMVPLIEDVTFHETRVFDMEKLNGKMDRLMQLLKF